MNRNIKEEQFGVPRVDAVEFEKIYSYDSNVINPSELFYPYLLNRGGRDDAIQKHVNEIADAIIQNGGMNKMPPIIVDINTLQIIDGNCRFKAMIKVLEKGVLDNIILRVIYENVSEEYFDKRVIELNQGQKPWGVLDFIYSYSLRNNENYTRLIDFCKSEDTLHKNDTINPRYAAAALRKSINDLKNSKLELTDEEIEVGRQVIQEADEIRKKFSEDSKANGGGWYEAYLKAWAEIRPSLGDISFKDYLRAIKHQIDYNKRNNEVPYGSNKKPAWFSFFSNTLRYEFGR